MEEKKRLLIRHGIALWDVAHSCIRPGSLDSDIRDAMPNDFATLFRACPHIQKVIFNGATAQKLYKRLVGSLPDGAQSVQAPSTSPAYTLAFEKKLALWRDEMEGLYV